MSESFRIFKKSEMQKKTVGNSEYVEVCMTMFMNNHLQNSPLFMSKLSTKVIFFRKHDKYESLTIDF